MEAKWAYPILTGWIWCEWAHPDEFDSSRSDLTRARSPAAAPDEPAGDSVHRRRARGCRSLRREEVNLTVGRLCAAVARTPPASSPCNRDGGGARRSGTDVVGRNGSDRETHLGEEVVWPAFSDPRSNNGGDRRCGGARRSLGRGWRGGSRAERGGELRSLGGRAELGGGSVAKNNENSDRGAAERRRSGRARGGGRGGVNC